MGHGWRSTNWQGKGRGVYAISSWKFRIPIVDERTRWEG